MQLKSLTFDDSGDVYTELAKTYVRHDKGLFILAPSGAGKTHYCVNQAEKHWIDGDDLWMAAKAHPDGPWWNESLEVINRVDKRSDAITMEAMYEGFWIMGASNYWLEPHAIVIPDWETHKAYIAHREENNYDGGATSKQLDQVKSHIEVIERWHTDRGVPKFASIDEAVRALLAI